MFMTADASISYEFVAPRRIVFGWGRRRQVGELAKTLGRRALIVCGSQFFVDQGILDALSGSLRASGVEPVFVGLLTHEPEVDDVDRAAAQVRAERPTVGDMVLAIGGGAAIDLGKAIAAMATNDESPTVKDYLEGVGRGLTLVQEPLPVLAMPTTAGTGAEATRNAVISSYEPAFKKSLRDERLVPRIALVDPELSVSVPPHVTAASGMDAITQLIESFISRKAQPIPQALALQGLRMAVPAIVEAVEHGESRDAREKMAHAALLSGMALANSGLGLAHGVAAALGVHARVPHGAACALMLPVALRVNAEVREAELAMLSRLLFGRDRAASDADAVQVLIREIEAICDRVKVPRRLSEVGVTREQIPALVASSRGSSMSGNPRELSDEELTQLLENLL
jgi:alcohol dehydrogenase class IV